MITCGFRFNIHVSICLLLDRRSQQQQAQVDHLFLFTYGNLLLITCGFPFNIYYLIVYFIQSDVNKSRWKRPPVFIYLFKSLVVITCGFPFNIHDLFVYLFKATSTKAGGRDHLFLFTYVNSLVVITCSFRCNIQWSICLFIQIDVNKSRWKRWPVFIYLCKLVSSWDMVFVFNIQYLFVYLFQAMSTKAGGSDDLYLLMQIVTSCQTWFSFLIFSIYLFIYSKRCQQKQVEATTFIYLWKLLLVRHGVRF